MLAALLKLRGVFCFPTYKTKYNAKRLQKKVFF